VSSIAPLVAPEPKLVTLRWLPRRTNLMMKRKQLPIFQRVGGKAKCLNQWCKNWRIWVSSKLRAWSSGVQAKEKITLWKVPLKPLYSVISCNVALHFPCQNFYMLFCNSGESNCIIWLPNPFCIFLFLLISAKHSLAFFPIFTFFNISSSLFPSQMPANLPLLADVN